LNPIQGVQLVDEHQALQDLYEQRKKQGDFNAKVCGICLKDGKFIYCDDCTSSFHPLCLGYEKQCPRGKWKCYFCKVLKHGIGLV